MKIIWDDNDKKFMENIRDGKYDNDADVLRAIYNLFGKDTEREFSISFRIKDPLLANIFIQNMFYNQDMNFEEVTGMKIISAGYSDKYGFIDTLDQISNFVENIKNAYNAKLYYYK